MFQSIEQVRMDRCRNLTDLKPIAVIIFISIAVTPSSAAYEQDMRRTWSKGSRMGSANRKSFIDVAKCSDTPGPGNYKIPS